MKHFALVLGAVVLAFALFGAWVQRCERRQLLGADASSASRLSIDDRAVDLDESPTGAQRAAAQSFTDALERAAPTSIADETGSNTGLIRLRGSVVVLDRDDVEHADEDGTLDFQLRGGEQRHSVRALVTDGQWLVDVPPCTELHIERAVMRGRVAVTERDFTPIPLPTDCVVDLRLHWLQTTVLHVRDAHTRLELSRVDVEVGFALSKVHSKDHANAGQWILSRFTGDSPLTIAPDLFVNSILSATEPGCGARVRAPNYAASLVSIDTSQGGDVFVDLMPAAALDVDVIGDDAARSARLRVRVADDDAIVLDEELAGRTSVSIDHLSPGRYRASLEFDANGGNAAPIASAEAELFAATRARIVLQPPPSSPLVRADMSGTVVIPREWRAEPSILIAHLAQANTSDDDRTRWVQPTPMDPTSAFDRFAWELKGAVIGRWELSLVAAVPLLDASVDLGANGLSDVRLEVAPPTNVRVRFVDEHDGGPIRPDWVLWSPREFSDFRFGGSARALFEPRVNAFEFRAPVGEIHVLASALPLGYLRSNESVVLTLGAHEFEWRLRRANGIVIRLLDGTRAIKARGVASFRLEPIEGGGKQVDAYFAEFGRYLAVSSDGRYRLRLEHLPQGYSSATEQDVDIALGTMTPVDVVLTRTP